MARGRPSTISRLEEPVQAEVNRLVRAGWTIDEIRAALAELGEQVSRSAVGRYVKSARESMEVYRQGQEVAKVWLDKLEADPQGDVARLLPEMLRAVAFSTLSQMGQGGEQAKAVKAMDVMLLAKAIKDLSGTTRESFAIDKARREAAAQARRELLEEQKAKLDQAVKGKGVTEETQAAIREALGIA